MNLIFSSKASKRCRPELERLLFFNERQFRVREGIRDCVQQFGQPWLEEKNDTLSIRVGNQETQTLFAYDGDSTNSAPIGVVVFTRPSREEIAIIHIAVHYDYTLRGGHGGPGLGAILVEKVKEIALRIAGVQRIVFCYQQELVV